MTKDERRKRLVESKEAMSAYLLLKLHEEDWHAVQDAASDLRDIESEIKGLDYE